MSANQKQLQQVKQQMRQSGECHPLSVGIQEVLALAPKARGLPITDKQMRYCLSANTKRPAHLKVLAVGGVRYD